MKTVAAIITVAAAITSIATPAAAQGSDGKPKVSYNAKTQHYCIKQVQPSMIVPTVKCRTVREWAEAGVTITRKPAVQLAQR